VGWSLGLTAFAVQGSGRGLQSFLVCIGEFAKGHKQHGITTKLFADDVKVYLEIGCICD